MNRSPNVGERYTRNTDQAVVEIYWVGFVNVQYWNFKTKRYGGCTQTYFAKNYTKMEKL